MIALLITGFSLNWLLLLAAFASAFLFGMAAIRGADQGPIVTQRYLNTATYAGDPSPGTLVSTSQVSGSIVQFYGGQLGGILTLAKDAANYYSDPVNGQQLYPGDYQYVQFYASSSASAAVQGQIVFWLDNTTNLLPGGGFVVTPDTSIANQGGIAGIALCNTAKGNYWFIQIAGIAQVKFAAANNAATPAVGDLVFADYATPSIYGLDPTQTTAPTIPQLKAIIGTAWGTAPIASTISPVLLGGPGPKYVPGGGGGEG